MTKRKLNDTESHLKLSSILSDIERDDHISQAQNDKNTSVILKWNLNERWRRGKKNLSRKKNMKREKRNKLMQHFKKLWKQHSQPNGMRMNLFFLHLFLLYLKETLNVFKVVQSHRQNQHCGLHSQVIIISILLYYSLLLLKFRKTHFFSACSSFVQNVSVWIAD